MPLTTSSQPRWLDTFEWTHFAPTAREYMGKLRFAFTIEMNHDLRLETGTSECKVLDQKR